MAGLHRAPFENQKVQANLTKSVPLAEGEQYVAYYDDTLLGGAAAGMVLTTKRLVQFKKGKLSTLILEELDALSHTKKLGVDYLAASSAECFLEQAFHDQSILDDFQAEISRLTGVEVSGPISALCQSLRGEVINPTTRTLLERVAPLREGEHYLACARPSGLLLTSQRVLAFRNRFAVWSVELGNIHRVTFEKKDGKHYEFYVVGDGQRHKVDLFGGQSAAVCRVLGFLIAEAQGKQVGGLEGVHMAGGSIVAIPTRPEYFEFEERADPSEKASLRVKANFPPVCAWCGSREVAGTCEVLLEGTILVKQSSGKKAAAVLIAGPLAGSMIGADKEYRGPFKFLLPTCKEHRDTRVVPKMRVHSTMEYWEGGVCLMDLRDGAYAEEFCRCNNP